MLAQQQQQEGQQMEQEAGQQGTVEAEEMPT
jgi:hypothetical protein